MGVNKTIVKEGSGPQPQSGQTVVIEYTGWLKDSNGKEGKQFDSSVGRGDFRTVIGKGHVIKGWDEAVPQMKVGEVAMLDISSDYAYGASGYPPVIPANSDLILLMPRHIIIIMPLYSNKLCSKVELKGIQ